MYIVFETALLIFLGVAFFILAGGTILVLCMASPWIASFIAALFAVCFVIAWLRNR